MPDLFGGPPTRPPMPDLFDASSRPSRGSPVPDLFGAAAAPPMPDLFGDNLLPSQPAPASQKPVLSPTNAFQVPNPNENYKYWFIDIFITNICFLLILHICDFLPTFSGSASFFQTF
jgi:hypothetical protein